MQIDNLILPIMTLDQLQRIAIRQALDRHCGVIARAARELDINPDSLRRKIHKWRLPHHGRGRPRNR